MTTDISEKGLETLIMRHMAGTDGVAPAAEGIAAETPDTLAAAKAAGSGWLAGNPKDGLWKEVLTPGGLTNLLENYAQVIEIRNPKTGRKKRVQVFPRYHQLDMVRQTLAHVAAQGAGARYLIQHSAGSGKPNSMDILPAPSGYLDSHLPNATE